MKTREDIYRQDAEQLLRDITTYHCMRGEQIKRIHAKKSDKIEKILALLVRQGRIFYDSKTDVYFDSPCMEVDTDMLTALWVLADFADKAEYHSTDAYPTEIIFFANGETYEIIYIPIGGESMILHAIKMCQDNTAGNRIFIVNDIEQINKIDFENSFFATVDMKCGAVQYYKKE